MRKDRLFRLISLFVILSGALMSCIQGVVPISARPVPATPTLTETAHAPQEVPSESANGLISAEREYAVVWIAHGDSFLVRQPAGISGTIVESLRSDARGITLTGNHSLLGSSRWVELISPSGRLGWAHFWNLTEHKSAGEFCQDERIHDLIVAFMDQILEGEGQELSQLISPKHGLTIRHAWYGPDIRIAREEAMDELFEARDIFWGEMEDSGLSVIGSFEKVILPKLQDVFAQSPSMICNSLQYGSSSREGIWPPEFANLNYLSFHRPAKQGASEFDWRTWAVGIEYFGGEPYIAVLIHFSSEL